MIKTGIFFSRVNFVMKCRKLLSLFCKIDILPRGDNIEYYLLWNFFFVSTGNTFSICGECQSQNDLCIDFFRSKKSRSIVKSFETKFYPRMSIFDIAYNLTDTNFNGKPHEWHNDEASSSNRVIIKNLLLAVNANGD